MDEYAGKSLEEIDDILLVKFWDEEMSCGCTPMGAQKIARERVRGYFKDNVPAYSGYIGPRSVD